MMIMLEAPLSTRYESLQAVWKGLVLAATEQAQRKIFKVKTNFY